MKLQFLGGNHEVTGSSTLLQIGGLNILIDCGIVQGQGGLVEFEKRHNFNTREFEGDINKLDYIILTHAHIDHIGRLPILLKQNPNIKVIATKPTAKLAKINLQDCAYLNAQECERYNKKSKSRRKKFKPIYTENEAIESASHIESYDYNIEAPLNDKVSIYLKPAGHIIGASMVEVVYREKYFEKKFLFTGDTSALSSRIPFTKPADSLGIYDYIITESTYGDKQHEKINFKEELYNSIKDVKGNVLLPTFSIHKSTVILYFLYEIFKEHPEMDRFEVYLDSPMATKSHEIIRQSKDYWYDKWTDDVFNWDKIRFVNDYIESQTLAEGTNRIIVSASGMLSGGRAVTSHLSKILSQKNSKIIFTGYVCEGSLAEKILTTTHKTISINGRPVTIKAEREMIHFSSHADKNQLVEFIKTSDKERLKKVFIIHGDLKAQESLRKELQHHLKDVEIIIPKYKDVYKLL